MHLADASNAPKVGYVIPRFVAWDWLPSFFHDQSPLIDSLRVWLRGSRHGDRFSGATLASQGVF
jgi:hypothetical protein